MISSKNERWFPQGMKDDFLNGWKRISSKNERGFPQGIKGDFPTGWNRISTKDERGFPQGVKDDFLKGWKRISSKNERGFPQRMKEDYHIGCITTGPCTSLFLAIQNFGQSNHWCALKRSAGIREEGRGLSRESRPHYDQSDNTFSIYESATIEDWINSEKIGKLDRKKNLIG